ncbi:MAG: peptide-methionine (S)-S-oxide reductase MsrA [Patescibacteria group bacterium]
MSPEIAIFGGGCFWCTEAVYQQLKDVASVIPGYAGQPKAEVIRIEYDSTIISYRDLLTVFFAVHDPTTLNRQGNDVGTQYRSIIFTTSPEQEQEAKAFIKEIDTPDSKIVTEVKPLEKFYEAEDYHRNYYQNNKDQPYCQIVISPKLEKLKEKFYKLLNHEN